jgi:hypothetical protein
MLARLPRNWPEYLSEAWALGTFICPKLQHPNDVRCIHCGHEPPVTTQPRALVSMHA